MKRLILVLCFFFGAFADSAAQSKFINDKLNDKIMGSLVGSAMGDAMGASTEMWSRTDREAKYGFIQNLTAPEIDPSAEGVWDRGYPAGATTDDTRWKQLAGNFLALSYQNFDAKAFANHILKYYQEQVKELNQTTNNIDLAQRKVNWIVEWAEVSEAYISNDIKTYNIALSKFYGGDLLCAGMLYSPIFGLPYAGQPLEAYKKGVEMALFDQGYARDITGLVSAMVAVAMSDEATPEKILAPFKDVDPYGFSDRRIFSRYALQTLQTAQNIVQESRDESSSYEKQLSIAWEKLDQNHQQVSPHAQEILLLTLTAMIFTDFQFQPTIEFLVNYGRDNDTTTAIAGAILGAYHGYNDLPEYKEQVINVAKDTHGIDLKELAQHITDTLSK